MNEEHLSLPFIEGVIKFNRAAGRTDDHFNTRMVAFHTGMQLEELAEVLKAIIVGNAETQVAADQFRKLHLWRVEQLMLAMDALGEDFKKGTFDDAVAGADRKELLDGCLDVKVVSVGSLMSQGVRVVAAAAEVNRSNLDKLVDGCVIKDANGKIQKPPGWKKPDLEQFVNYNNTPTEGNAE